MCICIRFFTLYKFIFLHFSFRASFDDYSFGSQLYFCFFFSFIYLIEIYLSFTRNLISFLFLHLLLKYEFLFLFSFLYSLFVYKLNYSYDFLLFFLWVFLYLYSTLAIHLGDVVRRWLRCCIWIGKERIGELWWMWQWGQCLGPSPVGHQPAGHCNGDGNECQQRRDDQSYD